MKERVLALGFFDGVHLGHAALMNTVRETASRAKLISAAVSFDTHPEKLVRGKAPMLINTQKDREYEITNIYGLDEAIFIHFDEDMMKMPWEDFVDKILISKLNAKHLVVGHDYRFGYKGEGTAEKLAEKCQSQGIGCTVIPKVEKDGIIVSSTYIRELISAGDMEKAAEFLGHEHFLSGRISKGKGIGARELYPTVNMQIPQDVVHMARGVYITRAEISGKTYDAVSNVGVDPTIGELKEEVIETHLLDFDASSDLHGEEIKISFYKYIRDEIKYPSVDELKSRIKTDIELAKSYFKKINGSKSE